MRAIFTSAVLSVAGCVTANVWLSVAALALLGGSLTYTLLSALFGSPDAR